MTVSPSLFAPLQPSSNLAALALVPTLPGDLSPTALLAGALFTRTSAALPVQGVVSSSWPGFPPIDGTDTTGALSLAFLLAADNVLAAPAALSPAFIDFVFTSRPGRNLRPWPGSRMVLQLYAFYGADNPVAGSVPSWAPVGNGTIYLTENERVRVPWEQLSFAGTESTADVPDALLFVPMVRELRTAPPGRTYTFAAVAAFM